MIFVPGFGVLIIMNMQKLSVLVNYVINQYIDILQAKTRKICEILSKRQGSERDKYTKRHSGGRESKSGHFNPRNLTLSPTNVSLSLSLSPTMSLSLSLSLSLSFFLTPVCVSIFLHPFLSFSHPFSISPHPFLSPPSLSLFPPPLFLFLSVPPFSLSLYQFVSFSIFIFNCVMQKNQEFVSG